MHSVIPLAQLTDIEVLDNEIDVPYRRSQRLLILQQRGAMSFTAVVSASWSN